MNPNDNYRVLEPWNIYDAPPAPRWEDWKHTPTITLHEGVALSLDVDPDSIDSRKHSYLDEKYPDIYYCVCSRLRTANRNLSSKGPLTPSSDTPYINGEDAVERAQFFAWAASVWPVPRELLEFVKHDIKATALAASQTSSGCLSDNDRDDLDLRSYKSLYRILMAILIDKYNWKVSDTTLPTSKILATVERAGLKLSEDTIRSWIKKAKNELLDELRESQRDG